MNAPKMNETTKTPLAEHYNNLTMNQQSDFKKFVNDDLGKRSRTTLRNWINGESEPNHTEKKLIAEFLKVNQQLLFPTKK